MPRQATPRSPDSLEFREVFKDNSIHRIKVIFWNPSHLQHSYPNTTWLILCCQQFLSQKLILLFFPGQIGVLYSSCFARSPAHLLECERFEGMDKRHFSNQHFFFLKRFFLFKTCFSLFISVQKVLLSWFLSRGLIWGRWSLQNWLDKLGNYNVEHAVLWNVL